MTAYALFLTNQQYVNPYQTIVTNGRYYLICNYYKYDNLVNYRVDRITNIRILDERRKPIKELSDRELNLPRYMAEHVYMYAGESIKAKFKAKNYLIDQLIDWFGVDISIRHIEVTEPKDMRERIAKATKEMAAKYK